MWSHPRVEVEFGSHASRAAFPFTAAWTTPRPSSPMGTGGKEPLDPLRPRAGSELNHSVKHTHGCLPSRAFQVSTHYPLALQFLPGNTTSSSSRGQIFS